MGKPSCARAQERWYCIDYRRLNGITKKDVYPLPRVDDILDTLGDAKYLSSLDLASRYCQVTLDPNSCPKRAFTTYNGLYKFVRMPFGLCNAPATFQRLMQVILSGLEWKSCFVYLDDILIASTTFEDHLKHLREVFTRFCAAGLRLKPTKCKLLRDEVPFLGHVIGIRPDPSKTNKVRDYPTPRDATTVRQFLGLASYYRRFVPGFAKVAAPLHHLTKKNVQFQWTDMCEASFNKLKELLVSAPLLGYPRFGEGSSFILETDASGVGLGAILSQEQDHGQIHPIAYASRTLDIGIGVGTPVFPCILAGTSMCCLYRSHCVSVDFEYSQAVGKLARWALTIQEMDITIKHESGAQNANADALSRNPTQTSSYSSDVAVVGAEDDSIRPDALSDLEEVRTSQLDDKFMASMIVYLQTGTLPAADIDSHQLVMESKLFQVIDGVLYFENKTLDK